MEHFYTTHFGGYDIGPFDSKGQYIQPLDAKFTDTFKEGALKFGQRNVEHSYTKVYGYPPTIGPLDEELVKSPSWPAITRGVQLGNSTYAVALLDSVASRPVPIPQRRQSLYYDFRLPGENPVFVNVRLDTNVDGGLIHQVVASVYHTVLNVRDVVLQGTGRNRLMRCTFEYGMASQFETLIESYYNDRVFVDQADSLAREVLDRVNLKPVRPLRTLSHTFRVRQVDQINNRSASSLVKEFLNEDVAELDFKSWSRIALDASSKHHVIDANYIESLAELASLKGLYKLAVKRLRQLPRSLKETSGDYLAWKYGATPLMDDIQQLLRAFSAPSLTSNSHSMFQMTATDSVYSDGIKGERRVHLYTFKNPRFNTLREQFATYGLDPNWSNLWDVVPFSFVVDWFVNVSSFLDTLSQNSRYTRLDIVFSIISEKTVRVGLIGNFELTRVHYYRHVSETPPSVDYTFSSGSGVKDHWLEGAALILQNSPRKR